MPCTWFKNRCIMKESFKLFDKVLLINLDKRPDRLKHAYDMYVKHEVVDLIERFPAIRPDNGDGRLGCILSHLEIIKKAKANGWKSILVLEDDALFMNTSTIDASINQLMKNNWQVYYLGYNSHEPLNLVDTNLLKIVNCFSTHAIAYHESFYDTFINAFERGEIRILDVWLRDVVQKQLNCYGCYPIGATQIADYSDIEGKVVATDYIVDRFYENTKHLKKTENISVCIPTYEMKGLGAKNLERIFNSLKTQSFKNFEVVVSDHSLDSNISNVCNNWSKILNIKYIKNTRGRGSSSVNINTAIQNASNDIVKIIFQDDYLIDNDALLKISNAFSAGGKWLIHSTNVADENMKYLRTVTASWNDNIVKGRNTIGAPSAVAIRKSDILFDENLIWLMDCDFYHRYYLKYGLPLVISEPLGAVTQWSGTLSSGMPQSTKDFEFKYVTKKYNL
jgi:hypothetical protein